MRSLRLVVCALLLACLCAPAVAMVTINVTTNSDEKNCNTTNANPPACHVTAGTNPLSTGCSLREALQNIDLGNNTSFPECTPAPETGAGAVNIINLAGRTIIINSLVPDPSDPTHTNMTRSGTMPDVFPKSTIGTVTIMGGDISCAPSPDGENIFIAAGGSDLTLSGVTIHDCNAFGTGLAVRSNGSNDLTVAGSNFFNIKATSVGPGAVISHHGGNLTIGSSSFTNCTQDNGSAQGQGGAVGITGVFFPNFVTVDSTNFLTNSAADSGGALYLSGIDSLTLSNLIFTGNSAAGDSGNNAEAGGGAIFAMNVGKGGQGGVGSATNFFLIFNNQFISNTASNGTGGAIVLSGGDLSLGAFDFLSPKIPGGIVASNFTGNSAKGPAPTGIDPRSGSGGAIYAAGNLSVLQSSFVSTIGANSSAHSNGGAIAYLDSGGSLNPLMIVNTTFNGNTADEDGGAIANLLASTNQSGKVQLLNDTLDSNTANGNGGSVGGGAFFNGNSTAAEVTSSNSIFSNSAGVGGNCAGQAFTNTNTNVQFPGSTCGASIPTGDPKLAGPSIFAGPNIFVFTQSLNAGSAASNAGTNSVCNAIPVFTFDGTGRPGIRPSPGGSNCDIGAYESGNAPVYASNPPPSSTINISALTTMPMTSNVVISNTGNDNLTISNYSTTGNPQITVSGPPGTPPFTIPVGNTTQTLTLTCQNAVPGNFNGTLTVTHNAAGNPATYTVNCAVTAPLTPLSITTASPLPNGSVGAAYSQTFAATGGTPPYSSWITTTPATFPAWATLDPNTGMLTGTPPNTAGSPFTFTIQVSDNGMPVMMATKQFTLTVIAPPLSITTASPLPNAMAGSAYNQSFAATGGVPPYTNWIVTTPATFPAWATLNPATGALTGTPPDTVGSPFTFTVQVSDSNAPATTTTKQFTLTVTPPPLSITTGSPLPNATVGSAYNQMFAATGGTPPYTNWAVTAGTAPAWANLAAATGAFTGTPPNTAGSPFTFTVTVTDSAMVTANKVFALQVDAPPLVITTASPLPNANVNMAYNQTFAAAGGVPPYNNWIVTTPATFPAWATLNPATGALTGTPPDQVGSPFTFTVQVTDSNATSTTKQFTLTVGTTPVTLQEFGVD